MRFYMPGPHRRFLEDLSRVANVREFVKKNGTNQSLADSFRSAVRQLRMFREKHLRIVSRYVILQSRNKPLEDKEGRIDLAVVSTQKLSANSGKESLQGTGGTALMPFLKQARDETASAAILN